MPLFARLAREGAWFLFLIILLSPFLFAMHRLAVFHTVPYDDYAGYLLWLAGLPEGGFPDSPYCYRLLSMVVAWPVFRVVPALGLTNTPHDVSPLWLRATLALNIVNYLCLIAGSMLIARLGRRRCGMSAAEAALAGALLFCLGWFTQLLGIDGIAILLIVLAISLIDAPVCFGSVMLVAVGANEKVLLVLALWTGVRFVLVPTDRRRFTWPTAISVAALVAYFAMISFLHYPGNEYQTSDGAVIRIVLDNLRAYASGRGIVLNVLPIVLLLFLWAFGHFRARPNSDARFRAVDVLVILGLAAVALRFTLLFQAGRIAMHAAPLFVIPAIQRLRGVTPMPPNLSRVSR
jgi:hypothetical protein